MTSSFQKSAEITCLKMRDLFPETPLQKNEYLSNIYGANIYLKREDLSPVRSYKIRGAFNAMSKAMKSGETKKLCAHQQGIMHKVLLMHVSTLVLRGAFICQSLHHNRK